MTQEEVLQIISRVQQYESEFDDIEIKSAIEGTPKRLYEAISAFSNHAGGGLILLGLDENKNFEIVGVHDIQRLQEEISHLAVSEMEPSIRSDFTIEKIQGKTILIVEINEIPSEQKPGYYKSAGLQKGSYVRIGTTNRLMSDYEIFGYITGRSQTKFDEEPVLNATLEDLDKVKIEEYITKLRKTIHHASYLKKSLEEILLQLRILHKINGILHPSLAGLLIFGNYPQAIEPQLVITFLQYYGTDETEKTPRGERFLDNQKFEGPIPEMIENAVNHLIANMRKSSLIEGLWRRDIPEYPEEAVREAIVNAVAHRDYSHFVRGSYIQIRLFADRLEIQSPGGLYGNVTEENLEDEQSTRNRLLMKLMEDYHLVENRGSGIRTMLSALNKANLEPPAFQDKRTSFWITFRNHTLITPDAIEWLNEFSNFPLNDRQRLALVYLKYKPQITNSDYQRLNCIDSVTANRELKNLLQLGLIEQFRSRRWAYYNLIRDNKSPKQLHLIIEETKKSSTSMTLEEKVLEYIKKNNSINNSECRELLNLDLHKVSYLLKKMYKSGLLKKEGKRKWVKYYHLEKGT
ncbi:MAG: ATP-binding protein [Candidatus Eremiobacterota bacterium]